MTITEEKTETMQPVGAVNAPANAMRTRIGAGSRLFVGEVRGELWATNSYWMVPASTVSALFVHGPVAGAYELGPNTKSPAVLKLENQRCPALDLCFPVEMTELERQVDLDPVGVDGISVYNKDGHQIYREPGGKLLALNGDFLDLMTEHPGRRVTVVDDYAGISKPVSVWRPLDSVSIKDGKQRSWVLAGILMPIRVQ